MACLVGSLLGFSTVLLMVAASFESGPASHSSLFAQQPSPSSNGLPPHFGRSGFPSPQGSSPFNGPPSQEQFPSLQNPSPFNGPSPQGGQFPPGFPPQGPPRFPEDLPPGFAEVLPPSIVAQLRAIHQDESLSWQQKHERIDAIMSSLPPEVLDRLPTPPGFNMLPPDVQAKLKAVHRQSGLNWQQRHMKLREIIESLTLDHRRFLLPPPPPLSGFGQTGPFQKISTGK